MELKTKLEEYPDLDNKRLLSLIRANSLILRDMEEQIIELRRAFADEIAHNRKK